jgi:hypothetical protein
MNLRRWLVLGGISVVIASALALAATHVAPFVGKIREPLTGARAEDQPFESELLAAAFQSARDRETPYRALRKGELAFNKQIAPIIYGKCARCHYDGGVAPFELTSFNDVKKRARRIQQVVSRKVMPPWMADHCSPEFVGDSSLTNEEKGMLEQWLAEGCREGNPLGVSPPPTPPRWPRGVPDVILEPAEPYKVPAEGPDIFRCFVIPTNFSEDRYVRIASAAPGSKTVHHILLYTDTSGRARQLDENESGPGFSVFGFPPFDPASQMGQWEPGVVEPALAEGVGYFLPKGADLVLHAHYHPTGKEETDLSRVALYFCDKPVDKRLRCLPVFVRPDVLRIGAGQSDAVFWAEQTIPGDITVVQVFPHMHLLGRQMAAAAISPGGATLPIIRISNWDFRWQTLFMFKNPLRLTSGSRVRLEASFDNSADNPRNPNRPPKPVRFGITTDHEMCILSLLYTVDSERLSAGQIAGPEYPDTLFPRVWRTAQSGRR